MYLLISFLCILPNTPKKKLSSGEDLIFYQLSRQPQYVWMLSRRQKLHPLKHTHKKQTTNIVGCVSRGVLQKVVPTTWKRLPPLSLAWSVASGSKTSSSSSDQHGIMGPSCQFFLFKVPHWLAIHILWRMPKCKLSFDSFLSNKKVKEHIYVHWLDP